MKKSCSSLLSCSEEKFQVFVKKGYPIMECKTCGHRYIDIEEAKAHIAEVYSDAYFFGNEQEYSNYFEEKDILCKTGVRYSKIIARHTSTGEVLDVGCAAGFILKGFEKSGWRCHGIEPNDTVAAYGRTQMLLDIRTGSLESYQSDIKFDLINLIQVIGHFYDVDQAMVTISKLLKPGGLVLVESWNMKSLAARIMGKAWHEYNPPSVVHWYSNKTLIQLFNYYGFQLIDKGRPSKKISMDRFTTLMGSRLPNFIFKNRLIKWMKWVFGKGVITYPPVDVKWYIFKKS